jgi:hypothetical protein
MAMSVFQRNLSTQRGGITANTIPLGTAIASDPNLDPLGYFNATTGLTMSAAAGDFTPAIPFNGFIVKGGAAGQAAVDVAVVNRNGSTFTWNISSIAANDQFIVEGQMTTISKTGTTAVLVFPIW